VCVGGDAEYASGSSRVDAWDAVNSVTARQPGTPRETGADHLYLLPTRMPHTSGGVRLTQASYHAASSLALGGRRIVRIATKSSSRGGRGCTQIRGADHDAGGGHGAAAGAGGPAARGDAQGAAVAGDAAPRCARRAAVAAGVVLAEAGGGTGGSEGRGDKPAGGVRGHAGRPPCCRRRRRAEVRPRERERQACWWSARTCWPAALLPPPPSS
jgi:hypothetical protein